MIPVLPVLLTAWLVGSAALTRFILLPFGARLSVTLAAQGQPFQAGLADNLMVALGVLLALAGPLVLLRAGDAFVHTGHWTRAQAGQPGRED